MTSPSARQPIAGTCSISRDDTAPFEPSYVISLDEIAWGGALVAVTMVMHAIGMLAMAGLLAFAWSTGVLFTLAQDFQTQRIQSIEKRERQESA